MIGQVITIPVVHPENKVPVYTTSFAVVVPVTLKLSRILSTPPS